MNFQSDRRVEDPEINLIPLIDLFLVIIIFLMVTTTYARYAELKINLPSAAGEQSQQKPNQIEVTIDAKGHYQIGDQVLNNATVETLAEALKRAAGGLSEPVVVISADAQTPHQAVIHVMEAARRQGLVRVTFATQTSDQ
ncbi:MAG: biopolymer transporter ExbD [Thiobacillaceae bacterium]